MKTIYILMTGIFALLFYFDSHAQWTAVAPYPGTANDGCLSIVINGMAYVGGGNFSKDFYQYNPATNSWTKKADIGGNKFRAWAFSFAINGKGYVGGGDTNSFTPASDFWQYDPGNNTWTRKADFGGGLRDGCAAFVINNTAYVGGGFDGNYLYNDLWKYNADSDKWSFIGNMPIGYVIFPVSFVINNKGYVGTGSPDGQTGLKQLWEFNPSGNTWAQKASLPGPARDAATGFEAGNFGYLVGGDSAYSKEYNDFWSYDPANNLWIKMTNDYPNSNSGWPSSFVIGSDAYVGMGENIAGSSATNQFYKYHFTNVGINEIHNIEPNIWPNPANDYLTVCSGSVAKIIKVDVYDLTGKILNCETIYSGNNSKLNTSNLSAGVYILQIYTSVNTINKSFIVQK